jgi:hypothetical protein
MELITKKSRIQFNKVFHFDKFPLIAVSITFSLVAFAWIFFRSKDLHVAFYISSHLFTGLPDLFHSLLNHQPIIENLGVSNKELILSLLLIVFLETVHFIQSKKNISEILMKYPSSLRWSIYYMFIFLILVLGKFTQSSFIYFQF